MKRILAIITVAIMVITMAAPAVFAAGTFSLEKSSPSNGQEGMAKDNMGIKMYFSEDVYSKTNEKNNIAACKMVEIIEKEENGETVETMGKTVPTMVLFNAEEKNVMMILADSTSKYEIKDDTKYRVTVDTTFTAANGDKLDKPIDITFRTLNSADSMKISMIMMVVMVVGMVFFTSRSMKKQNEKQQTEKEDKVNPYKVAKEKGISVEEVIAKEAKKKAKADAEKAKKDRHKQENKVEIAGDNFKVKGPKPVSAVGSSLKAPKKEKPEPPKNNSKSGNKNSGKKKGKK